MNRTPRFVASALALGSLSVSLAGCGGGASAPATPGFTSTTPTQAASQRAADPARTFRADGVSTRQVNIIFRDRTTSAAIAGLESKYGIKFNRQLRQINAATALIAEGTTPEAAIAQLKTDASIKSVELSRRVSLDVVRRGGSVRSVRAGSMPGLSVNDPRFNEQYGLAKISAPQAWEVTLGATAVKIAIIDTGSDLEHPDLKDKLAPGMNIPDKTQPPQDDDGHGSHTSCIAGAATNNGVGVAGVAPNVKIMPVKVLTNGGGTEADIAEGVLWAADNGADVASMSIGLYSRSEIFEKALQYALDHNVVLTASAGNRGAANDPVNAPHLPSTYPGVIEVAASDQNDDKADFSNFGATLSVGAPGVDIVSCVIGGYDSYSGTSMAAPHAAGVAALIRSQHAKMSPAGVKKLMEATADKLGTTGFNPNKFGWGRINALQAANATRTTSRR